MISWRLALVASEGKQGGWSREMIIYYAMTT